MPDTSLSVVNRELVVPFRGDRIVLAFTLISVLVGVISALAAIIRKCCAPTVTRKLRSSPQKNAERTTHSVVRLPGGHLVAVHHGRTNRGRGGWHEHDVESDVVVPA